MHLKTLIFLLFNFLLYSAFISAEESPWQPGQPLIIAHSQDMVPFQFIDSEGNPAGILIDYWRLWSKKSGIPVKFSAKVWEESITQVKQGKAHLHAGMGVSPERMQTFDLLDSVLAFEPRLYYHRKLAPVKDINDLKSVLIGVEKGSNTETDILQWSPDVTIKTFPTLDLLFQSLKSGEILAVYDLDKSGRYYLNQYGIQEQFESISRENTGFQGFSPALLPQQPALKSIVVEGMAAISAQEFKMLENKWLVDENLVQIEREKFNLALSAEEEQWLYSHPIIRVAYDPASPPFEFRDSNGEYQGFSADYLRFIGKRLGVEFDIAKNLSWPEALQALKEKRIDLLPLALESDSRKTFIEYSDPYSTFSLVLVTQKENFAINELADLTDQTVVAVEGYSVVENLKSRNLDINLLTAPSIDEALRMVSAGKADVFANDLVTSSFVMQKLSITNLKVAGFINDTVALKMAVRKDWPLLVSILNKAMKSISREEQSELRNRWFKVQLEENARIEKFKTAALQVGIIAFLITGFVMYWNRRLRQQIKRRMVAEKELEKQQQRFELAVAASQVGLIDWNLNTQEIYYSPQCLTMLGYQENEFKADLKKWFELTHKEDIPASKKAFEKITSGEAYQFEVRVKAKDGQYRWIRSNTKTVERNENGEPLRVVGTRRDITDDIELAKRLRKAKELAESANESKSQFLANMSHEIRTPMNHVLGMLELTLKNTLSDKQKQYLQTAQASARSLLGVLNDILDGAKIEAGKLKIESSPFEIRNVIEQVVSVNYLKAQQKRLQLDYFVQPEVPVKVIGDALRLNQVLMNLVSNAIKFTNEGSIIINVELTKQATDRVNLCFRVTDTGIGIDASKLSSLFDSFTQADASTTRVYGGTGLGLTISQKLVELMGGNIQIASEKGKGSEFFFSIAYTVAEDDAKENGEQESLIEVDLSHLSILVAEDNLVNQVIIEELLLAVGAKVSMVENGEEAVNAAIVNQFDIILMDIQMPRLDGYDATRQLRMIDKYSETPIIAMTAHALDRDKQRCWDAGMNAHVAKPIESEDLYKVLALYQGR